MVTGNGFGQLLDNLSPTAPLPHRSLLCMIRFADQVVDGHRGYRLGERQPLPLLRQPRAAVAGV